ncbi:MAG: radical SAM protein, partial [Bacteroidales bacterium]|nr:radical SAM protein [Bacteroidales bacterium]
MYLSDFEYDYPLFRPPSEANSLILQITFGCSWNRCAFCEMYTSKQFRIKKIEQIKQEIDVLKASNINVNKVFLADGDALVLKTKKLLEILEELKRAFPQLRRVSTYSKPKDLLNKSLDELKELKDAGLSLIYSGLETGDEELLKLINKGETYRSSADGLIKGKMAGIKSSVMMINGLGGRAYSFQHAVNSARLINEIQPEYLSTLVLSYPFGEAHFKKRIPFSFEALSTLELIEE